MEKNLVSCFHHTLCTCGAYARGARAGQCLGQVHETSTVGVTAACTAVQVLIEKITTSHCIGLPDTNTRGVSVGDSGGSLRSFPSGATARPRKPFFSIWRVARRAASQSVRTEPSERRFHRSAHGSLTTEELVRWAEHLPTHNIWWETAQACFNDAAAP